MYVPDIFDVKFEDIKKLDINFYGKNDNSLLIKSDCAEALSK